MTDEQIQVRDCLAQSIEEFGANPQSPKIMRRFATEVPWIFTPVAAEILMDATDLPGYRFLAMQLVWQPGLFKLLADPAAFTIPRAVQLSRFMMAVDPTLDVRFARQLPGRQGDTPDTLTGQFAERALDILDEISPGRKVVPVLCHLTAHADLRISSKATLLVGKRVQNAAFAKRLIDAGADPRICANALESIWGNDTPPGLELFWRCVENQNNRVAGNAMVGLFLAGDKKIRPLILQFSHDDKAEWRMTSAWAMGRIGEPEFIPTLSPLIKDENASVRKAALRSLQAIRLAEKSRHGAGAGDML